MCFDFPLNTRQSPPAAIIKYPIHIAPINICLGHLRSRPSHSRLRHVCFAPIVLQNPAAFCCWADLSIG